jgi:hypothetical protein
MRISGIVKALPKPTEKAMLLMKVVKNRITKLSMMTRNVKPGSPAIGLLKIVEELDGPDGLFVSAFPLFFISLTPY